MTDAAGTPEPANASPPVRILVLTATALAVGTLASLAAIAFVEVVTLLNNLLLVSPRARVQHEAQGWLVPAATVTVPAAGGLIVGLLLRLSPRRLPLGPPDVVQAVQSGAELPDTRSGAVSTLAAAVSLGFGASVGQYGPMVYLGAMAGGAIRRLARGVAHLPAIAVACGVAAAISTAFNAPIAGLVFAHEVVLRHYATQAFAPTTVASATGFVFANVIFERPPLFLVDFEGVANGYEFALFGLVGLLSAAVAIAFMRLVLGAGRLAARSGLPAWLRPAAAGLAVGVTALWLPDVLGIGTEALRFATIEGAFAPAELMVLVLAKILLTALCIGFGFAGGVFSPALLIGVLFGALCWTVVDGAGIATSGIAVYALCGMMATTSPVIGAPLATILIVFELTRNYDITIAAMVAVVFSNLVTHRLFGRSLFDVQLAARGVDLSAGRDRARLEAVPARRFAVRDPVVMGADVPLAAARDRLVAAHASVGFVTDADGTYRGRVRERDAAGEGTVAAAVRTDGPRLDETTTVLQAMRALEAAGDEAAPVVGGDGRLKGVVTRAALLQAFLDISSTLRREENAAL